MSEVARRRPGVFASLLASKNGARAIWQDSGEAGQWRDGVKGWDHLGVLLYHWTPCASPILRHGFKGRSGTFLSDFYFEDVVWFSDDGRGEQEILGTGELIEVVVAPGVDLGLWEVVEEGNAAREWALPAALVNQWDRRQVAHPPSTTWNETSSE